MKTYEVIWEIFNACANNQMRDVFFEELALEDPEEYLQKKFRDKVMTYERTDHSDGTIIFDIVTSGIKQRMSFTEV